MTFAVGADPQRLRDSIALVRSEREAAGLDPTSISIGAYVNVVAHPDVEVARAIARGDTAVFAHFSGMAGAPVTNTADDAVFEAIDKNYDMAGHASADAAHATAMPDDFVDRFAIAGPTDHCIARMAEMVEAGAERLVVVPGSRGSDPQEIAGSLGRLASVVLPALR